MKLGFIEKLKISSFRMKALALPPDKRRAFVIDSMVKDRLYESRKYCGLGVQFHTDFQIF